MDPYIHGLPEGSGEDDDTQCSIKHHEEEILIVKVSYTIGDPWTMMIHLKNTLIAQTAMMCPVRFAFHASLAGSWLSILVSLVLLS